MTTTLTDKQKRSLKRIFFLLRCGLVVLALYGTFKSWPITFHTTAHTEIVEVAYSGNQINQKLIWGFEDAEIVSIRDEDDPEIPPPRIPFTGSLEFNSNGDINIVITRIGSGPLSIRVYTATGSVGRLYENQEPSDISLGNEVRLYIKNLSREKDEKLIFPLVGQITIGRVPEFKSTVSRIPLLQSGVVTMRSHSFFSKVKYDAGTEKLDMGEQFSLEEAIGFSRGFVVISTKTGMDVILDGVARQGKVLRYLAKGYEIKAPLVTRIMNDPIIQLFWIAVGMLFGVVPYLRKRLVTYLEEKKSSNANGENHAHS